MARLVADMTRAKGSSFECHRPPQTARVLGQALLGGPSRVSGVCLKGVCVLELAMAVASYAERGTWPCQEPSRGQLIISGVRPTAGAALRHGNWTALTVQVPGAVPSYVMPGVCCHRDRGLSSFGLCLFFVWFSCSSCLGWCRGLGSGRPRLQPAIPAISAGPRLLIWG